MVPINDKIAVIGLGYIGLSIVEILNKEALTCKIYGYDIDNELIGYASYKGFIKNSRFDSLQEVVRGAELIILTMPLCNYADIVSEIFPFIQENTAVIELTSIKSFINNNVLPVLKTKSKNLVLCSPILSTVDSRLHTKNKKFVNIFENKNVLLTPYPNTRIDFINKANWLFQKFGSHIMMLDPQNHDSMMASILHFPYLIAFLYDVVLRESKTYTHSDNDYDDSFLEFRKLVKSNIEDWKEIFYYNASHLDLIMEEFHNKLSEISKLVQANKTKDVMELLESGFKKRVLLEGINKNQNKEKQDNKNLTPNKKKKIGDVMILPIIINYALIKMTPTPYSKYLSDDFLDFTKPIFNYKSLEPILSKSPEKVLKEIKKFLDLVTDFHILLTKKNVTQKEIKNYLRPSYID